MFEEVNACIDKKEVPGNLDRAVQLLEELKNKHPEKDIVRGKLAHACFYRAYFLPEGSAERERWFERGVNSGQEAITLNPRARYGNYWFASNLGMLGLCRGVMASLKSIDPMKRSMEIVVQENERFFFAGPHRALGRLYHQAPGWPISIGSKSKALEHLERAVKLAPAFFHNRLYLAELYVDLHKRDKAKEQLDWLISSALNPDHAVEDGHYQAQAYKLRETYF